VPDDLELLSTAAILSDRTDEGSVLRERAHQAHLTEGNVERAARIAIWTGMDLLQAGEFARAGGWISKGARLINEPYRDCVEQGYLLVPRALQAVMSGETDGAYSTFTEAEAIGQRFNDRDLVVLARHGRGRCLIEGGEITQGTALLDEAMVELTNEGIFPIVVGIVYCSVIAACRDIFDVRRAQEWTARLDKWSSTQADATAFRGECLVLVNFIACGVTSMKPNVLTPAHRNWATHHILGWHCFGFRRTGSVLPLRLDRLTDRTKPQAGLTGREVEVLALLATGKTNRDIAEELVISEKDRRPPRRQHLRKARSFLQSGRRCICKSGLA